MSDAVVALEELKPSPSSGMPDAVHIDERLVVAPATGRFSPLPPEVFTTEGEWVEPGQILGEVVAGSESVPVRSSFRGWVMGMLVLPRQPVRAGEALFWVRSS